MRRQLVNTTTPAVRGTVYGVILNDRDSLARMGGLLEDAPYKGAPMSPPLYLKPANTVVGDGALGLEMNDELRAADDRQRPDGEGRGEMKQRPGMQPRVLPRHGQGDDAVEAAGIHIAVGKAHALGLAGGAAGVIDLRDLAGVGGLWHGKRARLGEQRLVIEDSGRTLRQGEADCMIQARGAFRHLFVERPERLREQDRARVRRRWR